MEKFVSIDVETTGLTEDDEVVEFAFVSFTKTSLLNVYSSLVKGKKPISVSAKLINGINDNTRQLGKPFEEVLDVFVKSLGKSDIIVGNRIEFDLYFINRVLYSKGIRLPNQYVCVHKLHEQVLTEPFHLSDILAFYGISFSFRHRAVTDALATMLVFQEALKKLGRVLIHGRAGDVSLMHEVDQTKSKGSK